MGKNRDKIIVIVIIAVAAFSFLFLTIIMFGMSMTGERFSVASLGGRVALVDVKGVITSSEDVVRQIKKYEEDGSVKALVLRLDTPGGGVAASQEIYDQLLKFKEDGKPLVVSMGSVAASGGYYVACAADSIIANPGSVVGSIGVILSFPVLRELMDKVGVSMEVIKSGDLKDVGNYAREITPEDRRMLQALIDDAHGQFVGAIVDSRSLDPDSVWQIADGSVFTGRRAMELGLVDKLGTLEDAISVAGEMADLGSDPRVIKERPYRRPWWDVAMRFLGVEPEMLAVGRSWPTLEYRYGY
jgi:protease-4